MWHGLYGNQYANNPANQYKQIDTITQDAFSTVI